MTGQAPHPSPGGSQKSGVSLEGSAGQDQGSDPFGMPDGEIDGDLAAERVAGHHDVLQLHGVQPAGQVISVLSHAEVPSGLGAEPEAWQVGQVDRVVWGQAARGWHHVPVRHRHSMHEH
jgi:hypothetical protein